MDPSEERSRLAYTRDFIREARNSGLIDRQTYTRLMRILEGRWNRLALAEQEAAGISDLLQEAATTTIQTGVAAPPAALPAPPPMPPPPHRRATAPQAPPARAPAPTGPTGPAAPPEARPEPRPAPHRAGRPPSAPRWVQQGRRLRAAVASDLGIHGLAYLGVLLLFAGTFGLVFFSLQDVARDVRPVAEAAIPSAFFLSAWFLRKRRAPLVSVGIELVGGALLPIVVFASFVDKTRPDLTGHALVAGLATSSACIAVAYAWWASRHPGSPLRYLSAPAAWLAVATLAFLFKTDEPLKGLAVQRPVAMQMALAAAAVAATLLLVRVRPGHPLAKATRVAAVPGIALTYLLTIVLASTQRWSPGPLVIAGAAALVASDSLSGYIGAAGTPLLQSAIVAVTVSGLAAPWGLAPVGAALAIAYIGLFEWQRLRRVPLAIRVVPVAGVGVGLGMSLAGPWAALSAWSVASSWVHVRRLGSEPGSAEQRWLTGAAALLPLGVGYGLARVLPDGEAWLAIGAALSALATVVRTKARNDAFWAWWLPAAAAATALGVWLTATANPALSRWQLATAAGLAAAALTVAPLPVSLRGWAAARVWLVAAVAALALSLGMDASGMADGLRPLAWALAGLVAASGAAAWRREPAAHVSLIALMAAAGAMLAPASHAADVGTLGAWTAVLLIVVAMHEALPGSDSVTALCDRAGRWLGGLEGRLVERAGRFLPPLGLIASVPFLVVRAGSLWNVFDRHRSWSGAALAVTALVYAATARALAGRRPLGSLLATGAVVVGAIGIAVAAPSPWPTIESVAASIAVVWLMGGQLRRPFMTLFAWTMTGLLAVLLADRAGLPTRSLNLVSLAWGAILLVGGLALDDIRAGRRAAGQGLRTRWLAQPVAIGAIAVPASLGPVFTYHATAFGWWMAGAAALYLLVALQLRSGALSAATYALATAALVALLPTSPLEKPWIFAPWAALLVTLSWTAAAVARRRSAEPDPWSRWDLAPLVVAHGVAGLALVRAVALDAIPVTWAAFAALSAVVSAIRRHWAWALAGTVMALVASGVAGPAWLAVTLAGVSAASVVVALRSSGPIRSLLQATSVAAAAWAWVETIVAADWSAGQSVANSSLAFGGLALCIGALAGLGRLGRDWMGWWGGLALAGMVVAAGATAGPDGLRYVDDLRPAAGTLLFAAGSAMAARSAGWAWARWLTVGAAGWAWAEGAVGLGWSASEVVTATSLAAGTIAVLCGAGLRFRAEGSRWPLPWGALSGVGITAAGVIGAGIGSASAEPLPHVTGPLPATGVALFAVGLALSAGRFPRAGLQSLTAAAAGWAWMELAAGLDWSPRTWVPATALASGGTALVAAAGHRRGRIDRPWTLAWGGLGTIGVLAAIGSISLVERRPGALAAGGGLALLAGGAALAARPLSAPRLREVSSLLALACGAVVLYGVRPSPNTQVGAAAAAGFAAMVGSLALWRRNPDSHWLAPLALFAIAAAMASIPIAALDWPRRGPLVAALVVTGSEAAAAGFTLRRAEPLYLSPVLLCAAWLVYASEAIKGTPEPFTIPVGIALLVLVELARDDRRRHGKRPVTPELLVLEFAGMGFLVGAALVEIVATHLAYGLLAVALGGAVMAWGGVTRVRRRFAFGAVVAFVAIALMLAAPIAHNVPHFRGPALWLTVAAVGAVLITIAGLLEQGREKTKRAVRRLGELMEGWE